MGWYDTKQAAVDPDNPLANEQIPFSEWNNMVTYLKDKIINKTVDDSAIADDKILVYKVASDTFVFESQSIVTVLNDITDVVVSGVPADNELMAYNTATSKWINQTAAEAGLATTADIAGYLPLAGGTMTGDLNMGDYQINGVDDIKAYDVYGVMVRNSAGVNKLQIAESTGLSFLAYGNADMGAHNIVNMADPSSANHAATKNYTDLHVVSKDVVATFTDSYVLVYRTASGKFEMEAQAGGGVYLPLAGGTMAGDLDMGTHSLITTHLHGDGDVSYIAMGGGASNNNSAIVIYGSSFANASYQGDVTCVVLNATKSGTVAAFDIDGVTNTPIVSINHGLDMSSKNIANVLDPSSAQDASTKNYTDTHLFTKDIVTDFTNGYIPVYRTASGKFEMEDGGGSAGLPVADTTAIVKGSVDGTKKIRFEVDGLSTGVTRALTVPDKDFTICGTDDALLLSGGTMTGDLTLGGGIGGEPLVKAQSVYGIMIEDHTGTTMMEIGYYGGVLCNATGYYNNGIYMSLSDITGVRALSFFDGIELTIASGAVAATGSYHQIDTEGDASSDNLDNITGGSAGRILILRAESSVRTVVVRDGVGNLALSADMTMDNTQDTLSLIYDGSNWLETGRSNNGA